MDKTRQKRRKLALSHEIRPLNLTFLHRWKALNELIMVIVSHKIESNYCYNFYLDNGRT